MPKRKSKIIPAVKAQDFPSQRELEIESARLFGRHVSREKGRVLLVATLIACLLPVVLGLRVWNEIPEIIETGLLGVNGQDDSMPRWVAVFGMPGLMCILDLIVHMQFFLNQSRMKLPPRSSRVVGRWGFPIISVVFCSGFILENVESVQFLSLTFLTPNIAGLILMILGGHMLDVPENARIAIKLPNLSGENFRKVHNLAGYVWLLGGILAIAYAMYSPSFTLTSGIIIITALLIPYIYAFIILRNQS